MAVPANPGFRALRITCMGIYIFFFGGGGGGGICGPGMGWFFLEALDFLWGICRVFIPIRSFPSLEIRSTPLGVEIVVV